jgi:hypothetical protein
MTGNIECRLKRIRLRRAIADRGQLFWVIPAAGQYPAASRSD